MAETSPESAVGKFIGTPISTALGAYVAWLVGSASPVGSVLVQLLAIGGGICGLAFGLIYMRYLGVLGADGDGKDGPRVLGASGEVRDSPERQAYIALRRSLAEGNLAARL
jgi:hypothetical protein